MAVALQCDNLLESMAIWMQVCKDVQTSLIFWALGSKMHWTWKLIKKELFRVATGQEMVRERRILQGQREVREFYFESGKIDILKKSQEKLKLFNMVVLITLKAGGRKHSGSLWSQQYIFL